MGRTYLESVFSKLMTGNRRPKYFSRSRRPEVLFARNSSGAFDMKKLSLSVLMLFMFSLPASCDVIVTGWANSYYFGGDTFLSGGLCQRSRGPVLRDVDKVVWDDGRYNVTVELWTSCLMMPGDVGVSTIDVIMSVYGQLPTPFPYHEPWTMETTASGFYIYRDGSDQTFYTLFGPATFNLVLVSGLDLEFEMSFAAKGPAPIPEPTSFVLALTAFAGVLQRVRARLAE
jgi:hypothetical protein